MIEPQVQWTTASPLWVEAARTTADPTRSAFRRPALLRFASDAFMDELLTLLETDPSRLGELQAAPETWREPIGASAAVQPVPLFAAALNRARLAREHTAARAAVLEVEPPATQPARPPVKLFQAAHQRYYLVTACLVCRIPGLPDRILDTSNQERVSFVIRRLRPKPGADPTHPDPDTWDEYAFVGTGSAAGWQPVTAGGGIATTLVPGEEQLPLFPLRFVEEDERKRRLLAGLVPVGKREAYMGAGARAAAGQPPPAAAPDPRVTLFEAQVAEPWNNLAAHAQAVRTSLADPDNTSMPPSGREHLVKITREQIQVASWYILLDFARYLQQYLPNVWSLLNGVAPAEGSTPAERTLVAELITVATTATLAGALANHAYASVSVLGSLPSALLSVSLGTEPQILESITAAYDRDAPDPSWPSFLFPLADPAEDAPLPLGGIDALKALVRAALPAQPSGAIPPPPAATQPPLDLGATGSFVIRCVFERPNCGPLAPPLLSDPTAVFRLAGFFDPDAPARPIRITLPMDTTPAGLRKFDKNTAFMMSDVLCGQVSRFNDLSLGDLIRAVLPWPLHKDLSAGGGPCEDGGEAAGMVCTLSIPIITICAMIVLMVFVKLLDLVFFWMPFFKLCFPLPNFKAKEEG